ncbi:PHP domain protein, partial [gut metagenome]
VLYEYGLADGIYKETYSSIFGSKHGWMRKKPKYCTLEQVLNVAKKARGVVVFAHPSVYNSMECVRELVQHGLIDGLEINHPRNTEENKAELYKLALDNNLIITGGTDFHGINTTRLNPLGTCLTEANQIDRIEALAKSRKK